MDGINRLAGLLVLVGCLALATVGCNLCAVFTEIPTDTPTEAPTEMPAEVPTAIRSPEPSPTPEPTDTPRPTQTPAPTRAPLPTDTPTPLPPPPLTDVPAPPSGGVRATFLADARQTQSDLLEVKIWFDRLAGGETVSCATVIAHSIHRPSSAAPAQVADLVPIWNEYQAAIANGQQCLQWLVDFCSQGGGNIDAGTFWDRRGLSSDALSHCEHVVQALESAQ